MAQRTPRRRVAETGKHAQAAQRRGLSGSSKDIDAALIIGFYVAVAVLVIRVRRFDLAVTALVLTALLAIALVVQATVSERLGGYAALGLTLTVVLVGLAVRFGAWVGDDDV